MKKLKRNRTKKAFGKDRWYDLIEDWDLIEASFTAQYGIRLRSETEMSWGEFTTLLAGIMPKTPLGQIVSIRSEEDENMLKNFSEEQHRIRDEWRNRIGQDIKNEVESMTNEEKKEKENEVMEMFKKVFGVS
ncbi:Gp15 family bacteriophage protein [Clostridium sp.]|uniref:Gp15 family bacteriophage protein n=1 Tax=Clostridium sp. TaxID=1506 RepID=UPI002611E021|nr:Gp15 family bacteriophage protein [Clostridium sp.]